MTTRLNDEDPDLSEAEVAFVAQIRRSYNNYSSCRVPAVRTTSRWKQVAMPTFAALATFAAIGITAGGAWMLVKDDDQVPDTATSDSMESSEAGPQTGAVQETAREHRLVSRLASSWPHQTVNACTDYEPLASPEVIYVERFSEACLTRVPFGATVVFASVEADELGGVTWPSASEPWISVNGVQLLRKIRGEEFSISSRYVQGVWTESPREYAVYVGHSLAARAFEALDATPAPRTPDGASE
jgi:hypothetical protein